MWSFYLEPSWQTILRNVYVEPLRGTSGTWIILWNLWTSICGTFMWNFGESELLRVEPRGIWTFKSGNFMWNLGEPELFRVWCGTLKNLVPGFGRLPQTTPKLYWENPSFASCWGKNILPSRWPRLVLPAASMKEPRLFPYTAVCAPTWWKCCRVDAVFIPNIFPAYHQNIQKIVLGLGWFFQMTFIAERIICWFLPTSMGSPSAVPVPWHSRQATACWEFPAEKANNDHGNMRKHVESCGNQWKSATNA